MLLPGARTLSRHPGRAASTASPRIVQPRLDMRAIVDSPGQVAENARRRHCAPAVIASVARIAQLHAESSALRAAVGDGEETNGGFRGVT